MRRAIAGFIGAAALAGAITAGGAGPASAIGGGGGAQQWTMTSCNYSGGHASYSYSGSMGGFVVMSGSAGGSFFGTEVQLVRAGVRTMTQ